MRADLAQLDAESLAVLANRGLVKRAAKLIERGEGPELFEEGGTVTGRFPDGVVTVWPEGATLQELRCTCGAGSACRHGVAVALSYGEVGSGEAEASWSPAVAFDDQALTEAFGARSLTKARARLRGGIEVRVDRGSRPTAQLANGTVRFLVPHDLGLAHCDARAGEREVLIVLAVWGWRQADRSDPEAPSTLVFLESGPERIDLSGLGPARSAMEAIATLGISELPRTVDAELDRALRRASQEGWTWMVLALQDLGAQVMAWRERRLRYRPERAASLVAEVVARSRSARANVEPHTSWFLGSGVAPRTAPDRVMTLTGLGARVRSDGDALRVDAYLYDRRAQVVLVVSERTPGTHLAALMAARSARLPLASLAGGVLVTEGASREANRLLHLSGRRRQHDLRPGSGAWDVIAEPVRVADLDAAAARSRARAPKELRPRLHAEDLVVVPVDEVVELSWDPGRQVLHAHLNGPAGSLVIHLAHDPITPFAVSAVERALPVARFVAGRLMRGGSRHQLELTAVATPTQVVVPAFATEGVVGAVVQPSLRTVDPVEAALELASLRLAEMLHRGLDTSSRGLAEVCHRLAEVGLVDVADRVRRLQEEPALDRWATAWLAVSVARDLV